MALTPAAVIGSFFLPEHRADVEPIYECALRQVAQVRADVQLGFHHCYGDGEEEHFVQPKDAQLLADVAQAILAHSPRSIDWVHLPVPIERDDEAYFAPLKVVAWPECTELYLGLVHHEDDIDGAAARIAAARTVVAGFGVATECGFGRGPAERTAPLFDLHARVVEHSL